MIRIYVPRDSAARAVGADEVADAIIARMAPVRLSPSLGRAISQGPLPC